MTKVIIALALFTFIAIAVCIIANGRYHTNYGSSSSRRSIINAIRKK